MDDLRHGLLSVLECSNCRDYMLPPITSCENGHSVCNPCKKFLGKCQVCVRPFLNIRNIALENLAKTSTFPCSKRAYGCTEILPMDFLTHHENTCPYILFIGCPYAVVPSHSCEWKGPIQKIQHHIQMDHRDDVFAVDGIFVAPLPDLRHENFRHQVIFAMNELFFCFWERVEYDICFSVFYVGPNNKARCFQYNLSVGTVLSHSYSRRNCRIRNLDERNEHSRVGDYALVPYAYLSKTLYFNNGNHLQYAVEILSVTES